MTVFMCIPTKHMPYTARCAAYACCMSVMSRGEANHGISLVSKVRKTPCSGGEQKGRTHGRCNLQKSSIGHEQAKTAIYNLTVSKNEGFSSMEENCCLSHTEIEN